MNLAPERESKTARAYELIKNRISSGVYVPGFRLVIAPIATEIGVSAVPVLDAIRQLEAEGLVSFERNVGAQVALLNESEYTQTMQTLALMEGYATALAAPIIDTSQIARAEEINDTMKRALLDFDPSKFSALNLTFHSVLFEACPNIQILDMVRQGWEKMKMIRNSSFSFAPGRASQSIEEHEMLLDLLKRGVDAKQTEWAAREHRLATMRAVLEHNMQR